MRGVFFEAAPHAILAAFADSPALFIGCAAARPAGGQLPERGHLPRAGDAGAAVARAVRGARSTGTAPLPLRREPKAERFNLVVPRSACPACKAPIKALQNVPVVSWLLLQRHAAQAAARASARRYPLVEALTGVLSAAVGLEVRLRLAGARRAGAHLVT